MYWGEGSGLGLLTLAGDLIFMFGCALVWRQRDEVFVWVQDESSAVRRSLSRFTVVGPFYRPRPDSRLKAVPVNLIHSFRRIPRNSSSGGLILAFLGPLLILLDFFL